MRPLVDLPIASKTLDSLILPTNTGAGTLIPVSSLSSRIIASCTDLSVAAFRNPPGSAQRPLPGSDFLLTINTCPD